ncbi:alpha/beta fold hydrolase [Blastococcus sp. URHD0036]|uniref:alpha/beta fold hydrolase n=1 Tax=Blastococcus sp. URHD0036 TaxID=1380356 RepID=UPI00068F1E6D|nr:alpha/beta hydrolase [Blastococcus sp. URHD0036]
MAPQLHTESWGDGGRRALLVHGVTSSAATMWEVGEGLAAAGWTAVAVDLPGHGGSGPADSYRFADVAATVAAQLGGGWDVVVAHSLGGAIATLLLAGDPAFASRALLVDPALRVTDDVAAGLAPELRRDQAGQTEALVAAANPHWHPRTVAERVRSTRSTDVAAVAAYAGQNRPWDVLDAARRVRVPVHVLVPTAGPVVSADQVAELSATTGPRWTFETVPDTTHSLHRDRPALVVDRALGD